MNGGARAWAYLRCDRDYHAAWRARASSPEYEDAPFPMRVQSAGDRAALVAWRLLAWEDPDGDAASAFFADAPMLEGEGSVSAVPLLPLLADAEASLEGLRLGDGSLVLKVEKGGAAAQVRSVGDAALMAGGGVRLVHDWGLGLPLASARIADLWAVVGDPVPQQGVGGRARQTGRPTRSC